MSLKVFLLEAASEDEKLIHLEHAEDHVINDGFEGFTHAFHTLEDVKDQLQGKKNKTKITTKYDGSPSVVFGHNPDNGQFFVSTKSAFNVNPKLNYTFEDIEQNHGHAPGLVDKLKHALEHLPKVTPPTGVYQGDIMHTGGIKSESNPTGDVIEEKGKYHFKPNLITYSTPKGSEEGKKLEKSQIGIAVHTAYTGNKFSDLKIDHGTDLSHFKKHSDVHLINVADEVKNASLSTNHLHTYQHHLNQAVNHFKETPKSAFNIFKGKIIGKKNDGSNRYENEHHVDVLKSYINKTVKDDTKPSVEGYREHLHDKHLKDIAKVKTAAAVGRKTEAMNKDLKHIDNNEKNFQAVLNMHHHLQAAKDQLVHALSAKPKFEHSINGTKVKPEGYVVIRDNRPTKLVDRQEFSRQNFLARSK